MSDATARARRTPSPVRSVGAGIVCVLALAASVSHAQLARSLDQIEEIEGVGVTERLGERIPQRLTLTNSQGERVEVSSFFDGEKPVALAFVYFGCPVICPFYLDKLTGTLSSLDYTIGDDYRVVVVSIDHTEGVTESSDAKIRYSRLYGRDASTVAQGWAFLTGDEITVRQLADSVGWNYKQLPNGEYSHPAALTMVSPEGVVSRYMYGFDLPAKQMKLALLEASEGKIAESFGDKLMFYCYRFDPTAGAYSMQAMAVMRIAGIITVVGLVSLIGGMFVYEKATRKLAPKTRPTNPPGGGPACAAGAQGARAA